MSITCVNKDGIKNLELTGDSTVSAIVNGSCLNDNNIDVNEFGTIVNKTNDIIECKSGIKSIIYSTNNDNNTIDSMQFKCIDDSFSKIFGTPQYKLPPSVESYNIKILSCDSGKMLQSVHGKTSNTFGIDSTSLNINCVSTPVLDTSAPEDTLSDDDYIEDIINNYTMETDYTIMVIIAIILLILLILFFVYLVIYKG